MAFILCFPRSQRTLNPAYSAGSVPNHLPIHVTSSLPIDSPVPSIPSLISSELNLIQTTVDRNHLAAALFTCLMLEPGWLTDQAQVGWWLLRALHMILAFSQHGSLKAADFLHGTSGLQKLEFQGKCLSFHVLATEFRASPPPYSSSRRLTQDTKEGTYIPPHCRRSTKKFAARF